MKSPLSTSSSSLPRYGLRCGAFACVLFAVQAVCSLFTFHSRDFSKAILELSRCAKNPPDVVYLCDSTAVLPCEHDRDSATLPEMMQRHLPEHSVTGVCEAAFNMEVYEAAAEYLAARRVKEIVLIFPINLRLFAPQLTTQPYRYFDEELLFLRHDSPLFRVVFKPLAIFKTFRFRSADVAEFGKLPVLDGDRNLGALGFSDPAMAVHSGEEYRARLVTFYHMYTLHKDQAAVTELGRTLDVCRQAGIMPLPYVTPIDFGTGEFYLGPRFRERVQSNIAVVKAVVEEHGGALLDLSDILQAQDFIRGTHPDEHMRDTGRALVAQKLAERTRGDLEQGGAAKPGTNNETGRRALPPRE